MQVKVVEEVRVFDSLGQPIEHSATNHVLIKGTISTIKLPTVEYPVIEPNDVIIGEITNSDGEVRNSGVLLPIHNVVEQLFKECTTEQKISMIRQMLVGLRRPIRESVTLRRLNTREDAIEALRSTESTIKNLSNCFKYDEEA